MTGGQLLLDCLRAQGVTTVFGQPGNQLAALYRALYEQRDRVRHITVSNEHAGASARIVAQFRNARPRPAHLDIPQDILAAAVEASPAPRVSRRRPVPPPA